MKGNPGAPPLGFRVGILVSASPPGSQLSAKGPAKQNSHPPTRPVGQPRSAQKTPVSSDLSASEHPQTPLGRVRRAGFDLLLWYFRVIGNSTRNFRQGLAQPFALREHHSNKGGWTLGDHTIESKIFHRGRSLFAHGNLPGASARAGRQPPSRFLHSGGSNGRGIGDRGCASGWSAGAGSCAIRRSARSATVHRGRSVHRDRVVSPLRARGRAASLTVEPGIATRKSETVLLCPVALRGDFTTRFHLPKSRLL